jgi:hypothetical protein
MIASPGNDFNNSHYAVADRRKHHGMECFFSTNEGGVGDTTIVVNKKHRPLLTLFEASALNLDKRCLVGERNSRLIDDVGQVGLIS